jgi:hypothetical protein
VPLKRFTQIAAGLLHDPAHETRNELGREIALMPMAGTNIDTVEIAKPGWYLRTAPAPIYEVVTDENPVRPCVAS